MNVDFVMAWVEKSEHDYKVAVSVFRRRQDPVYDVVCFHCQQCVEKLLKAYLMSVGVLFQKTHDLDALRKQAAQVDPTFDFYDDLVRRLNAYAIDVRYPGDEPDRKEAGRAIKAMKEIRTFIRGKLKGI